MTGKKTAVLIFILLCVCGCVGEKTPVEVSQTTQLNQTQQGFELTEQIETGETVGGGEGEETANVRVAVTLDFGDRVLLDKEIEIEEGKTTAMDALKKVASVQTAYGGGFVEAINGHESLFKMGEKVDWFYTINGFVAEVGATQYILHPGDFEIWDYHAWDSYGKVAIIGAYPEPFVHGYNGMVRDTIIVYQNGFDEDAEKIKKYLESAGASVKVKRWDELKDYEKEKDNLILIGDASFEPVSHIFSIAQRLNLYAYIENENVVTVDGREYGDGCVIVAVNSPWNPKGTVVNENMVMVVAGTAAEEIEDGVNVLLNPDEIRYRYACVVVNGEVIPVP